MSRFPNAILLRLLAGRMFSAMADACLQSAKRRIEPRKRQEERAAHMAAFRAPRPVSGSLPAATTTTAGMVAACCVTRFRAAKTEGAMKSLQRFIYVIGPLEGAQKVGLTTDPKGRLATLQTGCPNDLVIHVAVRVPFDEAHQIEHRAHRLLERTRVRNEWFEATPAAAMAAVLAAAHPAKIAAPVIRSPSAQALPLFSYTRMSVSPSPIGVSPSPIGESARRPLWQVFRAALGGR